MSGDDYRRMIDTLAAEARMPPESATRIEQQLLRAFDERESTAQPTPSILVWRPWLAAAAALVLIVGSLAVWRLTSVTVNSVMTGVEPIVSVKPSTTPLVEVPVTPKSSASMGATTLPRPHRPAGARGSRSSGVIRPTGFVQLPGTAALPAFESGEIVRMDIPVASLPAYGIDISSGTGMGPVDAMHGTSAKLFASAYALAWFVRREWL